MFNPACLAPRSAAPNPTLVTTLRHNGLPDPPGL